MKKVLIGIISIIVIMGIIRINKKEEEVLKKEERIPEMFAIMVGTDESNETYENYRESKWPKRGYAFNGTLTRCVGDKDEDKGRITFDRRKREATVISKGNTYCYLYFDVDNNAPEFDSGYGNGGLLVENGEKCTLRNKKCTSKIEVGTTIKWKSDDVEAYCISNSADPNDCREEDWKEVGEGVYSATNPHILRDADEEQIVYAHIRDIAENISTASDEIILDRITPESEIKGYRQSNGEEVANDTWINERLKYIIRETKVGPSGAQIYYCEDKANTCNPSIRVTKDSERNSSYTSAYYVRYKIVSYAGLESEIKSYIGKADVTPPVISITSNGSQTSGGGVATVSCTDADSGVKSGSKTVALSSSGQVVSGTCVDNVGHERSNSRTFYYGPSIPNCGQTYHPSSCCCVTQNYDCSYMDYKDAQCQAGTINHAGNCGAWQWNKCPNTHQYCGLYVKNCCNAARQYIANTGYNAYCSNCCSSYVPCASVVCPAGYAPNGVNCQKKIAKTCSRQVNYDCSYYTTNTCWYGG